MKIEIPFSEVDLGESFEVELGQTIFTGVKSKPVSIFLDDKSSVLMSAVITKISPKLNNILCSVVGHHIRYSDSTIVVVDRCLPSGC